MKKYAKKVLFSSFIFILMFIASVILLSKTNEVNAVRNPYVILSGISVKDFHKEVNGNIYNIEVGLNIKVNDESYLNNLDVNQYGLAFFKGISDPNSISYSGYSYDDQTENLLYDTYFTYNLLEMSKDVVFTIDYSGLKDKTLGQAQAFLVYIDNVAETKLIACYLGDYFVKKVNIAEGLQYTDICYNGNVNINNFIPSSLLGTYCLGFYDDKLGTNQIANGNGTINSGTSTFLNDENSEYYAIYSRKMVFLLDENHTILRLLPCEENSTELPAIPEEYKTSTEMYNKSAENKYIQGLFNVANNLVYYNGKFNPFSTYQVPWAIALYPRYRGEQFSIVYNNVGATNGLETYSSGRLPCSETVTLEDIKFVKEGYSFLGWATELNSDVVVYQNKQSVKFNNVSEGSIIDLYPVWKANSYKLTINMNDGTAAQVYNFDTDQTVDVSINTERVGYTFVKSSEAIPAKMPAHDVTIDVTWSINKHYINFYKDNGGELYKSIEFTYGTQLIDGIVNLPTKTGYIFSQWNEEIPETMPDNDLSYYAIWTIKQISIKFDSDGGSAVETIQGNYNDTVVMPETPTRVGYVFVKWEPEVPSKIPENNLTCKAVWNKVDYIITCKLQNGEPDKIYSFGIGQEIKGIETPTKASYDFAGWDITIPEIATKDLTLIATWTPIKYCLRIYDAFDVDYEDFYFAYDEEIVLPKIEKVNYDFVSFSEDLPKKMPANDIEVTALWIAHKYVLRFETDGGTEISPILIQYKNKITLPENPTKDGCVFVSWDQKVPSIMTSDITLKAIWKKNNYNIKFVVDGKLYNEETVEFEGKITVPANPTATGYTFVSWDQQIPSKMPAHDVIINAVLDKIPCVVYFLNYDQSVLKQVQYYYGDKVEAIAAPEKEYYSFKGWYVDKYFGEKFDFENTTLTDDVTIYPYYKEYDKIYNISMTSNDYKVNIISKNGIYQNITFEARVVTNEIIDQYDFTKDFRYDYSKMMFQNTGNTRALGGVYTIKVIKDDVKYDEYDLPVTIQIQIPEDTVNKEILIFGSKEGVPFEVTDFKIDKDVITFDTETITEFVFGYTIVQEKPEEKGCNSKKIFEILGLVIMTASAIFIIRKRFGQE